MDNPIETFEIILKKHCANKLSALYEGSKQHNKDIYRPQDVLSNVSAQLKAIHTADVSRNNKCVNKDIQKYKKSAFLTVNNLPTYEEVPIQITNRFETQYASNTELIDVVDNAELIDDHRGMTQEFETSFRHTEKYTINTIDNNPEVCLDNAMLDENKPDEENSDNCKDPNLENDGILDGICNTDKNDSHKPSLVSEIFPKFVQNITEPVTKINTDANLKANLTMVYEKNKEFVFISDDAGKIKTHTIIEDIVKDVRSNQILNECIDVYVDTESLIERSPSPVFVNKTVKHKSKSPSPLVFDLDTFEKFESFAISMLESEKCFNAKHVINSQILGKELHVKTNEDVELESKDILDNICMAEKQKCECFNTQQSSNNTKEVEIEEVETVILKETKDIFFDESNCSQILPANVKKKSILKYKEDITYKTNNIIFTSINKEKSNNPTDNSNSLKISHPDHGLSDEILFSSDEENCEHNSSHDLPFTCALETSTYNHSDVLDNTIFVGFQTASNRSIQICKESLDKARNLLSDVDNEETSVTELVQICDRSNRGNSVDIQVGIVHDDKKSLVEKDATIDRNSAFSSEFEKTCKFGKDIEAKHAEVNISDLCNAIDIDTESNTLNSIPKVTLENNHFEGFKTANNKIIKLSDKALIRCKKVFQDIDIEEKYDNIQDKIRSKSADLKTNDGSYIDKVNMKDLNENEIKDLIQTDLNDYVIIQEFENIEMSLEEDKEEIGVVDLETVTENKHIQNEDILNNVRRDEVLKRHEYIDINYTVSEIDYRVSSNTIVGFKTASNKDIKISEKAISETKNIFEDIDFKDIDVLKKGNKHDTLAEIFHTEEINHFANMPAEGLSGFKTANKKIIRISKEALAKTDNIFKDIDSVKLGQYNKKAAYPVLDDINQPSTSKSVFAGFKTGNNKDVNISKTSIASVKTSFKDIVSSNTGHSHDVNPNIENLNKPSRSKESFVGSKTANNEDIHISDVAIKKTANIFNDLDSIDITKHKNVSKAYVSHEKHSDETNPVSFNTVVSKGFSGFKTADNKEIIISDESLAKTKNIFSDIDNSDIENAIIRNDAMRKSIDRHSSKLDKSCATKTTAISDVLKTNNILLKEDMFAIENNKEQIKLMPEFHKFQGFKTASNKDVKISDEALSITRNIFKDIDMKDNLNNNSEKLHSNEKDKECSYEDADKFRNRNIVKQDTKKTEDFQVMFKGFHTASDKLVTISECALAKAKNIFKEIGSIEAKANSSSNKLPIHDKENKSNTVLRDDKVSVINKDFFGFQTANNKVVNISEEALSKSRKILENIDKDTEINSFKGFQTASNKKVDVSDHTLAKCKKIFQDIININHPIENLSEEVKDNIEELKLTNFDYKSVSNEAIFKREDNAIDLEKDCDRIFTENHEIKDVENEIKPDNKVLENIEIDTQLLNNFEETLYTEDFKTTPIKSKRSGSPILSCPRAKRRKKFETPYSQTTVKTVAKIDNTVKRNSINFDENYKRNKIYKLRDLQKFQDENASIDPYLLNFSYEDLLQFEYNAKRSHLDKNITISSLKQTFLNSVNAKLIPDGWIDNHLKLILWKLISYEVKYPKSKVVCNTLNVINQLKYRYDKELYSAERPALRKILEKDDLASKPIVLCVVQIYEDGAKVDSVTNLNSNIELLVSDGWYCVKASVDRMLAKLVYDQRIVVGGKIVTNGAELINCEQGIAPWEDTSSVRLKLFGNSTRRARWDARLGYHSNAAILSHLSAVNVDGGKVSKLRVYVTRVYPALYVEKFEDGSTVTRSERLEHLHQMRYESERQTIMEKLYEEVEKEFSDQESQDSEVLSDSGKRTRLDSGTQIAKLMKRSIDPVEFRALLSSSQTELLADYTTKRREKLLQDIQDRIRDKVAKNGLMMTRNVVPVLKIRVAGVEERNGSVQVTKGMLSIWKPNEGLYDIIKEGAWIDVFNVVPTAVRFSEIQMSAGRQSFFSKSKHKEDEKFIPYTSLLKRKCYTIKELAQNPAMTTDYNEIDTIGLVFLIEPSIQEFESMKQPFQNVYIADSDKNMISINFWGGLRKFGFENILDTGQVVSCGNLQKRAGNTRKSIPQYRATEFSQFTKTPKNESSRIALESLNKTCTNLDRRKFCNDCVDIKNKYAVFKHCNSENISPYRPYNSDYNVSKNKQFIDSPLARRVEDNFNLTGLDFESTFKHTDTEDMPKALLLRKKRTHEKINKLRMYGEPPPLSPILILNKSINASKSYKSPLTSKLEDLNNETKSILNSKTLDSLNSKSDSSKNVTTVTNAPHKIAVTNNSATSPVLLNRTYVKEINPVKLNFDNGNNINDIDHFAEEFDGSPPLSLD